MAFDSFNRATLEDVIRINADADEVIEEFG